LGPALSSIVKGGRGERGSEVLSGFSSTTSIRKEKGDWRKKRAVASKQKMALTERAKNGARESAKGGNVCPQE